MRHKAMNGRLRVNRPEHELDLSSMYRDLTGKDPEFAESRGNVRFARSTIGEVEVCLVADNYGKISKMVLNCGKEYASAHLDIYETGWLSSSPQKPLTNSYKPIFQLLSKIDYKFIKP